MLKFCNPRLEDHPSSIWHAGINSSRISQRSHPCPRDSLSLTATDAYFDTVPPIDEEIIARARLWLAIEVKRLHQGQARSSRPLVAARIRVSFDRWGIQNVSSTLAVERLRTWDHLRWTRRKLNGITCPVASWLKIPPGLLRFFTGY